MRRSIGLVAERQKFVADARGVENKKRKDFQTTSSEDDAYDANAGAQGVRTGDGPTSSDGAKELDEAIYLANRNAFLSSELRKIQDKERRCAKDPRLIDKYNEVALLQKEINDVNTEIDTLRIIKKRQDASLREIEENNEDMRRAKGHQGVVKHELRMELRSLQKQLREAQKESTDAHNRFGALQEAIKMNVSQREVDKLRSDIKEQEEEIHKLLQLKSSLQSEYDVLRSEDFEQDIRKQKKAARGRRIAEPDCKQTDHETARVPRRGVVDKISMQLQNRSRGVKLPLIH